jgi:hypothetical protein
MKRITLLSLIFTFNVFAAVEVTTGIYDVLLPETEKEDYLVLGTDGIVYEIDKSKQDLIDTILELKENNEEALLTLAPFSGLKNILNNRDSIVKASVANLSLSDIEVQSSIPTPVDNFEPTIFNNMEIAGQYFKTMRTDTRKRSQCFNRAHVWTYELSRRNYASQNIKMRKIFIFFTSRYIRNYNYKWWFHVAPLAKVANQNEDVVFDREFARVPQLVTDWKNDYMKNKAFCPEVFYYSDYRQNQNSQDCYFIKTSMYYWEPTDIENLEKTGVEKTSWVRWEIEAAYRQGFK